MTDRQTCSTSRATTSPPVIIADCEQQRWACGRKSPGHKRCCLPVPHLRFSVFKFTMPLVLFFKLNQISQLIDCGCGCLCRLRGRLGSFISSSPLEGALGIERFRLLRGRSDNFVCSSQKVRPSETWAISLERRGSDALLCLRSARQTHQAGHRSPREAVFSTLTLGKRSRR